MYFILYECPKGMGVAILILSWLLESVTNILKQQNILNSKNLAIKCSTVWLYCQISDSHPTIGLVDLSLPCCPLNSDFTCLPSFLSPPNSSSFRVAPFLAWSCTPRLMFFLTLDNLLRPGLLPPFDHTQQSKTQRLSWYQINRIPKGVRECLPLENQGMLL